MLLCVLQYLTCYSRSDAIPASCSISPSGSLQASYGTKTNTYGLTNKRVYDS